MGQYRPQRTVTLYVAEVRILESGKITTKLTKYPAGEVGAVYPMLAWDGIRAGSELPIVLTELMCLYQALMALHVEGQPEP